MAEQCDHILTLIDEKTRREGEVIHCERPMDHQEQHSGVGEWYRYIWGPVGWKKSQR